MATDFSQHEAETATEASGLGALEPYSRPFPVAVFTCAGIPPKPTRPPKEAPKAPKEPDPPRKRTPVSQQQEIKLFGIRYILIKFYIYWKDRLCKILATYQFKFTLEKFGYV